MRPKVTHLQWLLVVLPVLISGFGYWAADHSDLLILLLVLAGLNIVLTIDTVVEALQSKVLGKFFLAFSTCIFFWLEAIGHGLKQPPFTVVGGPAHLWGQFPLDQLAQAFFYIALFQFSLYLGYSVQAPMPRFFSWVSRRADVVSPSRSVMRYLLAACIFIPLALSYGLNFANLVDGLIASRSGSGPEVEDVGFYHYLYFAGMYGAGLFLLDFLFSRSLHSFWVFLCAGITTLPFILGGTRHLWLYVALPICVAMLRRYGGRITLGRIVSFAAVALLVLSILHAQLLLREIGWLNIEKISQRDVVITGATGQFSALMYAQYLVPEIHDYFYESAEYYFIVHWIPRRFWPDKPVMPSWSYYNDSYTQGGAFNVTPSVIGQFHMNWGWPGIIYIGLVLGFLSYMADRAVLAIHPYRQRAILVVVSMLYAFIVCSFRFYSPVYFTYFVFGVIAMIPLTRTRRAQPQTALAQENDPALSGNPALRHT